MFDLSILIPPLKLQELPVMEWIWRMMEERKDAWMSVLNLSESLQTLFFVCKPIWLEISLLIFTDQWKSDNINRY